MAGLPGVIMDKGLGLGLEVASGASKAINLVGNIQGGLDFAQPFLDFLKQRAESSLDTTVQQYSAHLLAEMNDCVKMATALHDALLPEHVGLFIDADALVNALALSLAAELQLVQRLGRLAPPTPYVLNDATLSTLSFLASDTLKLEPETPEYKWLSGVLSVVGHSHVMGSIEVGFDSNAVGIDRFRNTAGDFGQLGDFQLLMNENSVLTVSGEAIFNAHSEIVGQGGIQAANLVFQGLGVLPGQSPGTLVFDAPVTMTSGTFDMEVGGNTAGSYDQVRFTQSVSLLGGNIHVVPLGGYHPEAGTSVQLFSAPAGLDFSRMNLTLGDFGGMGATLQADGRLLFGPASSDDAGTGPSLPPPPTPPRPLDVTDWNGLAALATANFLATGQWYVIEQPPVQDWNVLAAEVSANFAASGSWYL